MKLKVCGIKTVQQLEALSEMEVDYAGIIFYEGSKRYAGKVLADQKNKVKEIDIKKVGVFVNAEFETIIKAIEDYGLYAVQLHGDETDEFCLELMGKAKVIKAIRVEKEEYIESMTTLFERACDYFLFDTETKDYGGSGKQFDWNVLTSSKINKPFFLSGGIGLEDVKKINAFHHPFLYALDINSKFETEPGIKDLKSVQQFGNNINHG